MLAAVLDRRPRCVVHAVDHVGVRLGLRLFRLGLLEFNISRGHVSRGGIPILLLVRLLLRLLLFRRLVSGLRRLADVVKSDPFDGHGCAE